MDAPTNTPRPIPSASIGAPGHRRSTGTERPRRAHRLGVLALAAVATVAGLALPSPAEAEAPTCTPLAPLVVGSRRGLTVEVRPCVDPVGVAGYRLTAYPLAIDPLTAPEEPTEPYVIDVPAGSRFVRIPAHDADGLPRMKSYRFRARAIGAGEELGPLGPSSATAAHPYTTASAAVNRTWADTFGGNPMEGARTDGVHRISTSSLFTYLTFLLADPYLEADSDVAKLYLVAYGRFPDTKALEYWANRVRSSSTRAKVARSLADTAEFHRRYDGLSNRQFTEAIYRNSFGTAGDAEGVAFWTKRLDERRVSRGTMISEFTFSAQFMRTPRSALGNQAIIWVHALFRRVPSTAWLDAVIAEANEVAPQNVIGVLNRIYTSPEYVDRVSVVGPPVITAATDLPDGTVGAAYSQALGAEPSTGTGPLTWTVTGLPPGLSLTTGPTVSGTPTEPGSYPVTVTLTDATGRTDHRTATITVDPA